MRGVAGSSSFGIRYERQQNNLLVLKHGSWFIIQNEARAVPQLAQPGAPAWQGVRSVCASDEGGKS